MLKAFKKAHLSIHPTVFVKKEIPKISIIKIYEELTNSPLFNRNNNKYRLCLCPFHQDHHPSMALYPQTNSYFCFSCRAGGDSIKFIMDYLKVDFKKALEIMKKYE